MRGLQLQKKTGLLSGMNGIHPPSYTVRATIPVIESLVRHGAVCDRVLTPHGQVYHVCIGESMPEGIVATTVGGPPYVDACLRMSYEPGYQPFEYPDMWVQGAWLPCPACGAPVVWYEAGYVPGYRVCTRPPHHHSLLK